MMADLVDTAGQALRSATFDSRGNVPEGRFRNHTAAFVWGFAVVFAAAVVAISVLYFLRDVEAAGSGGIIRILLALFWLGCFVFVRFACRQSVTEIRVEPGTLEIDLIFPFRRRTRMVPQTNVATVGVVDSFDSDGHPYYYARVRLIDGTALDFCESHNESTCQAEVERFKQCLNQ